MFGVLGTVVRGDTRRRVLHVFRGGGGWKSEEKKGCLSTFVCISLVLFSYRIYKHLHLVVMVSNMVVTVVLVSVQCSSQA